MAKKSLEKQVQNALKKFTDLSNSFVEYLGYEWNKLDRLFNSFPEDVQKELKKHKIVMDWWLGWE